MPWMPGIPHDQGTCPQGSLRPLGVVAHRTYGSWNGDYQVGLGSRDPVGFHFLIGPDPGQWVQFYSTDVRCAHAGTNSNGNDISVGIEVTGTNEDPMTPWQIDRVRDIVFWLQETHGIIPVYRFSTAHNLRADHGYIPHSAVHGSDHSDYWTVEDWARIIGEPEPTRPRRPDMILVRDPSGTISLTGPGMSVPVTGPADLAELQKALDDPGHHTADVSQAMQDRLEEAATRGS